MEVEQSTWEELGEITRAIYSYCDIGDIITPSGWSDWNSKGQDYGVWGIPVQQKGGR